EQRYRGWLSTGKNVVSDRYFFKFARFDYPLINAFETATDDHHAFSGCELSYACLRQRSPTWAHEQSRATMVGGNMVDRFCENIRLEYHACAPTCWRIVHRAVPILGEVTNLHCIKGPLYLFEGLSGHGKTKMARKHFGIERQDCCAKDHCVYRSSSLGEPSSSLLSRLSATPAANGSIRIRFFSKSIS